MVERDFKSDFLALVKQEGDDVKEWLFASSQQLTNEDEQVIIDEGFVIKSRRMTTVGEAPMSTEWVYELVKRA